MYAQKRIKRSWLVRWFTLPWRPWQKYFYEQIEIRVTDRHVTLDMPPARPTTFVVSFNKK